MGVKGACPLGLPPPLGEGGGHPRNSHAQLKKIEGISTEQLKHGYTIPSMTYEDTLRYLSPE